MISVTALAGQSTVKLCARLTVSFLLLVMAGCSSEPPLPATPLTVPAAAPTRTTPEIQFLALVEGIPGIDTSTGDDALVKAGYKACNWSADYEPGPVADAIAKTERVDSKTATVIVHSATTYLCPALG